MTRQWMTSLHIPSATVSPSFHTRGRKAFTLQTLAPRSEEGEDVRLAKAAGFSLHCGVAAAARQRKKLERLCRYIARPAIANERLSLTGQGNVRYRLADLRGSGLVRLLRVDSTHSPRDHRTSAFREASDSTTSATVRTADLNYHTSNLAPKRHQKAPSERRTHLRRVLLQYVSSPSPFLWPPGLPLQSYGKPLAYREPSLGL